MMAVEDILRTCLVPDEPGFTVTLDPALQGLPGAAHGGSVPALFDEAVGRAGARRLTSHYAKRVPVGAPLRLRVTPDADGATCALFDGDGVPLVEGGVRGLGPASPSPADGPTRLPDPSAQSLPVSRGCFVCGVENALGLGVPVVFDEERVWATWWPRTATRWPRAVDAGQSRLAPLALTALLDEVAFWLGALATGESGLTTDLAITLQRDAALRSPLVVTGDRRRVAPRARDLRYVETAVDAIDGDGALVATATITFVVIRGAARRLAAALREVNPPAVVGRAFPRYETA
jgi:acyl-coenzyme A thioesterase PaaI-like protein